MSVHCNTGLLFCKLYSVTYFCDECIYWYRYEEKDWKTGSEKKKNYLNYKYPMTSCKHYGKSFFELLDKYALISFSFPFLQFHLKEYPLLIQSQWAPLLNAAHSALPASHNLLCCLPLTWCTFPSQIPMWTVNNMHRCGHCRSLTF